MRDRERRVAHLHRGEGAQRDRLAGARFHINLVEQIGRFAKLRLHFENDAELIELGENDRDLALAERVVKRVVDGLGQDVEARRFFAIDIDIQLQAIDLLIAGHVGQLRKLTEFLHEFRCPLAQLRGVRILQNVLELSAADARVDLQILRRLHEKRDAFDVAGRVAQTFDDFFRIGALVVRLEHNVKPRGVDRGVDRSRAHGGGNARHIRVLSGRCRRPRARVPSWR